MNTAYVINLDRRTDRWERAQQLWSPFFKLIRVSAVETPGNGARGCKESHVMIAEQYLKNNDFIIVIEDDSEITPWFSEIGHACLSGAEKHIHEWDFVNCSPLLDLSAIRLPVAQLKPTISPLFLKASYAHQTNFMLYNKRSLPVLNASLRSPLPVDMWIARNAKNIWVTTRLLAIQDGSASDIRPPFKGSENWYGLSEQMLQRQITDEQVRAWNLHH